MATDFIELTLINALDTSHVIVGITEGAYYRFKVQAVNIYGAGPVSTAQSIRASDVPSQMNAPVTSRNQLNLVVDVNEPNNNGAALLEYEILLLNKNTNAYVEDTTYCDGSTNSTISSRQCLFSFTYLMSQYGYTRGQLVYFKARARNDDGWSQYSNVNSAG